MSWVDYDVWFFLWLVVSWINIIMFTCISSSTRRVMGRHASPCWQSSLGGAEEIGAGQGGCWGNDEGPPRGRVYAPWSGALHGDRHPRCRGISRGNSGGAGSDTRIKTEQQEALLLLCLFVCLSVCSFSLYTLTFKLLHLKFYIFKPKLYLL